MSGLCGGAVFLRSRNLLALAGTAGMSISPSSFVGFSPVPGPGVAPGSVGGRAAAALRQMGLGTSNDKGLATYFDILRAARGAHGTRRRPRRSV